MADQRRETTSGKVLKLIGTVETNEVQKSEIQWSVNPSEGESQQREGPLENFESDAISYKDLAYAILIPVSCLFLSAGMILIPQQDVFEHPGHWYEISMPITMSYVATFIIITNLRLKVFFKDIDFITPTTITKMVLINVVAVNGIIYLSHVLWTVYLGYNYPIPWLYLFVPFSWWFALYFSVYVAFPAEYRKNAKVRKKIFWFFAYTQAFTNACVERLILIFLFIRTPEWILPVWAIVLPIWKEMDYWYLYKIEGKMTDGKNRDATICTSLENQCNYVAVLSIAIGLYATDAAAYCILAVDVLMNLKACYDIIKINKKVGDATNPEKDKLKVERDEAVQNLVMDEIIDVLMPIVYCALVLVAFYGPNATILGNIGSEKWQWKKIEDMEGFMIALVRMFVIDLVAFLGNSLILWKFSSINAMKEICFIMKNYWAFISVTIGGAVVKVQTLIKNWSTFLIN